MPEVFRVMAKTMADKPKEYKWPHPRYTTSKDKQWLEGRLKHPTGFCTPYNPLDAQGHEGTKPKSRNGNPLPICTAWETCPCTCHKEIDDMYALAGIPRPEAEQNPDYEAVMSEKHLATQVMLDSLALPMAHFNGLSNSGGPTAHDADEGPATGDVATSSPIPQPQFAPTPTGRRARGQLEYDVLKVCQDFAEGVFDWPECTPKLVSIEIGKLEAVEPPSTGAINAVWDRWEALGFATQAKKPSRFVKFNVESPTALTLDRMKSQVKRERKRGQAEQKRGTLRPRSR
jgi:hypothetical protein